MSAGEFDLIARLVERVPSTSARIRVGSGDDAAVTAPSDRAVATTVDAIVEDVHFTLPEFPLEAVGRKALAAALSDLAAMAAEPGEAYASLAVPARLDSEQLLEIADGIAAVAEREGVAIAGGDLSRGPALMIALTCVGYERDGARFVRRAGARAGDAVVLTGELGGAAAALALLEGTVAGDGLDEREREALLARQLDPRPRFAAAHALSAAGATAMVDVSDGVGADAAHLARASGVHVEIELERVPPAAGLDAAIADEAEARRMIVSGGEDFELLATVPAPRLAEASEAVAATGVRLTQIGEVSDGEGAAIRDRDGAEVDAPGFDHIRGSRSGSA